MGWSGKIAAHRSSFVLGFSVERFHTIPIVRTHDVFLEDPPMPFAYLASAVALSALALFTPVPSPEGFEGTAPALLVSLSLVLFYKAWTRLQA